MRTELEVIEQIENYLLNKMSPTDKSNFEEQLKTDSDLQSQTEFQQNLVEGIKRVGVQASVHNAYKGWKLKLLLTKVGIGILIVGAVSATVAFWPSSADEPSPQETAVETIDQFLVDENDSLFAEANQYLDQELFEIENDHDTVIETKDGLVVYIPANAFDTDNDKTDIVVQGALNPEDILRSGLNTMTEDGDTLETGGMFYIDAFAKGERVGLNKELTVDVPSDPSKTGMMLYDGEKDENGEIVWKDPKELTRPLTPVDILSLDFYPPGYEDWMDKKGYLNKDFKDSLYFSFAFENWSGGQGPEILDNGDGDSDNFRPTSTFQVRPKEEGASTNTGLIPGNSEVGMLLPGEWQPQDEPQGDTSFQTLGSAMPNSVDEVVNWKFSIDYEGEEAVLKMTAHQKDNWHIYSQNQPSGAVAFPTEFKFTPSNEYNLIGRTKEFGAQTRDNGGIPEKYFPGKEAKFEQRIKLNSTGYVKVELEYAFMAAKNAAFAPEWRSHTFYVRVRGTGNYSQLSNTTGVDPASVETIWNEKFNNTNLATKEFEMRMPYIHRTCNTSILELYINNLDMDLSDVDELAVSMGAGAKFQEFADMNQGSVEMDDASSKALSAYYEKKRKMLAEAVRLTNDTYWKEQYKMDQIQDNATQNSDKRNQLSNESTYAQELKHNSKKVYKDLGMSKPIPRTTNPIQFRVQTDVVIDANGDLVPEDVDPASPVTPIQARRPTVRTNVGSLGWKNVDCLMSVSRNRESVKIKGNGRTTSITYMPWSVSIADYSNYDKVNVYNIPKQFNSYVKLKGKDGMYAQNLNMDLTYKTAIVAWNKDGLYYNIQETSPGKTTADLKPVSRQEFDLNVKEQLSGINKMAEEMEYAKLSQSTLVRQNTNKFKLLLRAAVHKVIFPCGGFAEAVDQVISELPIEAGSNDVEIDANGNAVNNVMVEGIADVDPSFPGGEAEMRSWINRNLRYPKQSLEAGEEGTVYVQFIVGRNGMLYEAKVVRGVSSLINRESIRLVNTMPNWKPAQKDGKDIQMLFTLPITFKIS